MAKNKHDTIQTVNTNMTKSNNQNTISSPTTCSIPVMARPPSPLSVPSFPPENDRGPIEYKWRLLAKSAERIRQLTTQMLYRLEEGNGRCVYLLGVHDDGRPVGLEERQIKETVQTVVNMADTIKCTYQVEYMNGTHGQIAKVSISRSLSVCSLSPSVSVAFLGASMASKSTLTGVLATGALDNANGAARLHVFTHRHEMTDGRTSAIARQFIRFSAAGAVVRSGRPGHARGREQGREEERIVDILDLAGDEQYSCTTLSGLVGQSVSVAFLCVSSVVGVEAASTQHAQFAHALNIPMAVIITKTDLIQSQQAFQDVVASLDAFMGDPAFPRVSVDCYSEAARLDEGQYMDSVIQRMNEDHTVTPIFALSCVSGHGLQRFQHFLSRLRRRPSAAAAAPLRYWIDGTLPVDDTDNAVVTGCVKEGEMRVGKQYWIGPIIVDSADDQAAADEQENHGENTNANGTGKIANNTMKAGPKYGFIRVTCRAIHVHRVPVSAACVHSTCSVELAGVARQRVRRGMTMTEAEDRTQSEDKNEDNGAIITHPLRRSLPCACYGLRAVVRVFPCSLAWAAAGPQRAQHVLLIGTARQAARLIQYTQITPDSHDPLQQSLAPPLSSSPHSCLFYDVLLCFVHRPECAQAGDRFIIRDDKLKAVGVVTQGIHSKEQLHSIQQQQQQASVSSVSVT